jgi:hypothetical protein
MVLAMKRTAMKGCITNKIIYFIHLGHNHSLSHFKEELEF